MTIDYQGRAKRWQADTARKLSKLLGCPVRVDRHDMAVLKASDLVRIAEALEYCERDLAKLTLGLPY